MIYVVNKTDQGLFSPLSASGTAELLYVASSSPTATSKQSRVASLRNSISERVQRQKAELCQGMLEPGADTTKTKPSLSSPVLADFRRLCKIQHLLSLEAKVHSLGFTPRLWEVGWGLLCCWQLEISICSSFLFPFQNMHHTNSERLHKCTEMVRREDIPYHSEAFSVPSQHGSSRSRPGQALLIPTSCRYIPWCCWWLPEIHVHRSHPTWDATWQTSEPRDWEVCWGI